MAFLRTISWCVDTSCHTVATKILPLALLWTVALTLALADSPQSSHRWSETTLTSNSRNGRSLPPKPKAPEHLRLDLSGHVETHLVGPAPVDDALPPPVFELPISNFVRVSVLTGANYDFSQQWFGVNRIFGTLRFHWTQKWHRPLQGEQRAPIQTTSLLQKLRLSSLDLTREQSLLHMRDRATTLGCKLGRDKVLLSEIKIRITDAGQRDVSLSIPWMRRFCWQCNVSNPDHLSPTLFPGSSKKYYATNRDTEDDWWIPDVRVDALGQIEAKNEVWFRSSRKSSDGFGTNLGFMLKVKRRTNFSPLGFSGSAEPECTQLSLDVCHVGHAQRLANTLRVETLLEQPLASMRFLLRQNFSMQT
jgi:hypothetical protein